MMKHAITQSRFAQILNAYGADPACWPADERSAAEALLVDSGEARQLWRNAQKLDDLMNTAPTPAPASQELRMRLVDSSPQEAWAAVARPAPAAAEAAANRAGARPVLAGWWETLRSAVGEFGGLQPAGAALAASLVLGVVASGLVMPANEARSDIEVLELALLSNTFEGY